MQRRSANKNFGLLHVGDELGNTVRNERQKLLLLSEVSRMRREQIDRLIETGKEIVEHSKKLCKKAAPEQGLGIKPAG